MLILKWREIRKISQELDPIGKFQKIENFLKRIPNKLRGIDVYDSETWASPWEILGEDEICDDTKTIIFDHSMRMMGESTKLFLIKNEKNSYLKLVCVVNNELVYGFETMQFMPLHNLDMVLYEFIWDGIKKKYSQKQ